MILGQHLQESGSSFTDRQPNIIYGYYIPGPLFWTTNIQKNKVQLPIKNRGHHLGSRYIKTRKKKKKTLLSFPTWEQIHHDSFLSDEISGSSEKFERTLGVQVRRLFPRGSKGIMSQDQQQVSVFPKKKQDLYMFVIMCVSHCFTSKPPSQKEKCVVFWVFSEGSFSTKHAVHSVGRVDGRWHHSPTAGPPDGP